MRCHKKTLYFLFFVFIAGLVINSSSLSGQETQKVSARMDRGVWVSVFSKEKPLNSKEGVYKLINVCKESGINQIYLQLYQSGNAYYDSLLADKSKYEETLRLAGIDTVDFLLKEAKKNNIKVFAWVNILSLGKNSEAYILKKFGSSLLTCDQYSGLSSAGQPDELDKYYLKEKQLFLEPGDPRVWAYSGAILTEIINRYPLLSGIQLDYIRYPAIVPFLPGSRFNKFGISYGYGKYNLKRFKEKSGIDPLKNSLSEEQYLKWDNWKRQQLTHLVKSLSRLVKKRSPGLLVSCAVVPSAERAYLSFFQDWPLWLEENLVDYVVLMNYTPDNRLAKEIAQSALACRGKAKVHIGLGLFLLKEKPVEFREQLKIIEGLNPDGIVFYSYDDLTDKTVESLR